VSDELIAPQEVSDPDSLRDVLLFCGVLLVEIYSLSVAFGGPFLEVGYFLLVVISQTIAGAYIWAKLREHERILPLPELLAMGFAIGSASAAISQLIIRDLLGIRMFVSPLVPIIAVIIWRTFKKNPQLPVQISHAKTNTLLWLLFPAPLALLNSSLVISIIFIAPLLLLVRHIYRQSGSSDRLSLPTVSKLSVLMITTSLVHKIIFSSLTKNGSGISRIISDDIRFDIAYSIGFAKWGSTTNIELSGESLAYYKISHLWMGPIIGFDGSLAINLCATVLPIFLLVMLGLALLTLTYKMTLSLSVAGLGSIIFFTQANLSNSIEINLRAVWILGVFYLVIFGAIAQSLVSQKGVRSKLLLILCGFILAGTRLSFWPFALAITNIPLATTNPIVPRKLRVFIRSQAITIVTLTLGAFVAFLSFVPNTNSTNLNQLIIDAGEWPIRIGDSLNFAFHGSFARTILFFAIISLVPKFKKLRFFTLLSTCVYLVAQMLIPRVGAEDATLLFPYLIILSPIFALVLVKSWTILKLSSSQTVKLLTLGLSIGFIHKTVFDSLKERQTDGGSVRSVITMFILNETLMTVSLFAFCALISICMLKKSNNFTAITLASMFLILGALGNAGISIGVQTRPVLEYFRYEEKFLSGDKDPIVIKWSESKLIKGLSRVVELSNVDDIVATNFGLYRGIGSEDNLRLHLFIERRAYISGRFMYFQQTLPLIFKQTHTGLSASGKDATSLGELIKTRIDTSIYFPTNPSRLLLENLQKANVKWFVVDLGNTPLRDWEPWATTRFINEKVAILELPLAVKQTD